MCMACRTYHSLTVGCNRLPLVLIKPVLCRLRLLVGDGVFYIVHEDPLAQAQQAHHTLFLQRSKICSLSSTAVLPIG